MRPSDRSTRQIAPTVNDGLQTRTITRRTGIGSRREHLEQRAVEAERHRSSLRRCDLRRTYPGSRQVAHQSRAARSSSSSCRRGGGDRRAPVVVVEHGEIAALGVDHRRAGLRGTPACRPGSPTGRGRRPGSRRSRRARRRPPRTGRAPPPRGRGTGASRGGGAGSPTARRASRRAWSPDSGAIGSPLRVAPAAADGSEPIAGREVDHERGPGTVRVHRAEAGGEPRHAGATRSSTRRPDRSPPSARRRAGGVPTPRTARPPRPGRGRPGRPRRRPGRCGTGRVACRPGPSRPGRRGRRRPPSAVSSRSAISASSSTGGRR